MSSEFERRLKKHRPPRPPAALRKRIFGQSASPAASNGQTARRDGASNGARCEEIRGIVGLPEGVATARGIRNLRMRFLAFAATLSTALLAVLFLLPSAFRLSGGIESPDSETGRVDTTSRTGMEPRGERSERISGESDRGRPHVAFVNRFDSVVWSDGATVYEKHDRLGPGDVIGISQGQAVLTFDCGVRAVVEGPAQLEIIGEKHVRMGTGTITARAWKGGEGFRIDTPQANIVDLSTEFGVRVDPSGMTNVAVFQGAIDIFQHSKEASNADPLRLSTGTAAHYGEEQKCLRLDRHGTELKTEEDSERFNIFDWHRQVAPVRQAQNVCTSDLDGIVVDATLDDCIGDWVRSRGAGRWVGDWYFHDIKRDQESKSIRFSAQLPQSGKYEVRLAYSAWEGTGKRYVRASNVPVEIQHADGSSHVSVDQRCSPPIDNLFVSLGEYPFTANRPAVVLLRAKGADGYVTGDAIQFLKVE